VTLTTLGYGDIVAATPLTRLFTALEAAQGALYLAIFIGRLLSTFQEEQRREDRIREARQREGRGRD
jgi:voltage-gated potassium channel Kch